MMKINNGMIGKMKRNYLLALGLVVILTMLVLPASAKKENTYSAQGKLTDYEGAWTSRIVSGTWSVTVIDGQVVEFSIHYVEENLSSGEPENSPVGSKDIFWNDLTWASTPDISADKVLTFDCTGRVTKLWSTMDGGKEWVTWNSDPNIWHVTVGPDGILIEKPSSYGENWNTLGTTTKIKMS